MLDTPRRGFVGHLVRASTLTVGALCRQYCLSTVARDSSSRVDISQRWKSGVRATSAPSSSRSDIEQKDAPDHRRHPAPVWAWCVCVCEGCVCGRALSPHHTAPSTTAPRGHTPSLLVPWDFPLMSTPCPRPPCPRSPWSPRRARGLLQPRCGALQNSGHTSWRPRSGSSRPGSDFRSVSGGIGALGKGHGNGF